jgi:hypothetical protein
MRLSPRTGATVSGDCATVRWGAVVQQVNHLVALQVNYNRAIRLPFADRPVVDAQHAWRGVGGWHGLADEGKQGIRTRRHPQAGQQARAGFPAEREGNHAPHRGQAYRATRTRRYHGGQAFRKDALRTCAIAAEEFTDTEHQGAPQRLPTADRRRCGCSGYEYRALVAGTADSTPFVR